MINFLKFLIFASLLVFLIPAHLYRVVYFDILVEVMFLVYVWLLVKGRLKLPKISLIGASFFVFIIVSALATIFSIEPTESFWGSPVRSMMGGLFIYLHYFIFFVVLIRVFNSKEDYLKIFKSFSFIGFLVSIYGLYQRFFEKAAAIESFLGNQIYLGTFLLFILFINAYLILNEPFSRFKITKEKAFYIMTALCAIANIYFSVSRGPVVGIVASLFFIAPFLIFNSIKYKKVMSSRYFIATIFLVTILLFFSYPLLKESSLAKKFIRIPNDPSVLYRLQSWEIAGSAILEKPLLGWGQDNFDLAFYKYFNPKFALNTWFDRAHSNILDIGVSTGVLGIISYLFIWTAAIWALFYLYKQHNEKGAIILGGLLIAYFINNLFIFDTLVTFLPFVLVLAYLNFDSINLPINLNMANVESRKIFMGIFVVLIVTSLILNFQIAKASNYYYKIKFEKNKTFDDLVNYYNKTLAIKPAIFEKEATLSFSKILSTNFNEIGKDNFNNHFEALIKKVEKLSEGDAASLDIKPYYYIAELNLASFELNGSEERLKDAENYFKKIIEISPNRKDVYQDVAQIKINENDYSSAIFYMKKVADLDADYYHPHLYLAALYILNNQYDLADKELNIIGEKDITYMKNDISSLQIVAEYVALEKKDYRKSINLLWKVLILDPKNIDVRKKIASLNLEIGEKWEAQVMAQTILSYDPSFKEEFEKFINFLQKKD